jgi:hypothetical protein
MNKRIFYIKTTLGRKAARHGLHKRRIVFTSVASSGVGDGPRNREESGTELRFVASHESGIRDVLNLTNFLNPTIQGRLGGRPFQSR